MLPAIVIIDCGRLAMLVSFSLSDSRKAVGS